MKSLCYMTALLVVLSTLACEGAPADDDAPAEAAANQEEEHASGQGQQESADDDNSQAAADDEQASDEPQLEDDLAAGETAHYGAEFTVEDDPLSLADALDALADQDGEDPKLEDVKIAGQIEQVCQKKGCWFTLASDEVDIPVRIRMEDYAFFIPRNTAGADVIIEGNLEQVVVEEEMARHLAEDSGDEDPEAIEGDQDNYLIMSRGISVTQPES